MDLYEDVLDDLKKRGRLRSLALPMGIDLTSNDYLGMAVHPALKAAAIDALESGMDVGAAGSRLLRGHTQAHEDLERFAAGHFKSGGALFFSSGFQANYALLTTLPQKGDIVLYDALAHASMRDGLLSSKAKSFKFAHNDPDSLERQITRYRQEAGALWIACESVYSMDGDLAPLAQFYALAERYDVRLIIDEAHATGVLGDRGRGAAFDLLRHCDYERIVTLHTCGKAIGVAGGLVCASRDVIDYLINAARPFIYSTAPMPLQAFLVQKSLEILASGDGDARRARLQARIQQAERLFGGVGSHIVPIILGRDERAVAVATCLQEKGYDVRAVRPPSVPEGSARLRVSLSSELDDDVLQAFANDLKLCVENRG